MQSECEILKLRKNNLLENIANQDKILEEKLREGKINQQVEKEIWFYGDCDVEKNIENVNKKWDTKILGMSNINVNTAIQQLSNISNILEQIEPIISNVNDNLTKQERKALKELQEDQDLVIRKADKGNTLILMDKDYYCGELVMKQHLSASTYQKVDSNIDKHVFNNLKILIKKHESCLTKNEMKYILNSNWKSSNFYVLPKIHKSKKIIEEINENNSIFV